MVAERPRGNPGNPQPRQRTLSLAPLSPHSSVPASARGVLQAYSRGPHPARLSRHFCLLGPDLSCLCSAVGSQCGRKHRSPLPFALLSQPNLSQSLITVCRSWATPVCMHSAMNTARPLLSPLLGWLLQPATAPQLAAIRPQLGQGPQSPP